MNQYSIKLLLKSLGLRYTQTIASSKYPSSSGTIPSSVFESSAAEALTLGPHRSQFARSTEVRFSSKEYTES